MYDGGELSFRLDAREAAARRFTANLRIVPRLLAVLALVASLAQHFALASYRVAGTSMTPAFLDGDRIVVAAMPGFFGEPRVGETVIACVNGEVLIKRVAGVPGDLLEVGHGEVRRNGARAVDPIPASFHDDSNFGPIALHAGEYFLLGDHRRVSIDSREFGPVQRAAIVGRVILRVPTPRSSALAGVLARH